MATFRQIINDRSFQLSIIITSIFFGTGILFLFAGLVNYSWMLFVLLPIIIGISIGALPGKTYIFWASLVTIIVGLFGMQALGLSGLLCIMMVLPLTFSFVFLGYVIAHLVKRYRNLKSTSSLPVLIAPLLLFLVAAPIEHFLQKNKIVVVEVSTEKIFNYTPQQVYDAIKSVDTLVAEKPYLMKFDLPIPTKCVLQKEEVGGLRICYFRSGKMSNADFGSGTIVEKITQLEKAKVLKMDVVSYNLIGRKWIGFKEAIYYFDKVGDGQCKLTRVTTYTSELTPRIYWEPLERLGIRQEHDYVFANLLNDLERKFAK